MIDAQAAADAPNQAREHDDEIPFLDKPGRENPGTPDTPAGKAHKARLDNPEPPKATGEKPQGAADRFQVMSGELSMKAAGPMIHMHEAAPMERLTSLRDLTLSLAKWYGQHPYSHEQKCRAELIRSTLEESFQHWVPGDQFEMTPQIREAFNEWRQRWNDISVNGKELEAIEAELEAAWALTIALSEVVSNYPVNETKDLLSDLFGIDMKHELKKDRLQVGHATSEQQKFSNWPAYLAVSTVIFAIGLFDQYSGAPGSHLGPVLGIGLIGIVTSVAMLGDYRWSESRNETLTTKWNGSLHRDMPLTKKYFGWD